MEGVLKASYGDEEQRAANRRIETLKDRIRSRQLYEQHKARAKPGIGAQLPAAPAGPPRCPGKSPFWVTKYQGTAYGAFNPQKKPAAAKAQVVEVRPGVLVGVQQRVKPGGGGKGADAGAPGASRDDADQPGAACHAPAVLQLEEALRAAARSRAALHRPARQVLLSAFGQVGVGGRPS
jgi:hypothetical protein